MKVKRNPSWLLKNPNCLPQKFNTLYMLSKIFCTRIKSHGTQHHIHSIGASLHHVLIQISSPQTTVSDHLRLKHYTQLWFPHINSKGINFPSVSNYKLKIQYVTFTVLEWINEWQKSTIKSRNLGCCRNRQSCRRKQKGETLGIPKLLCCWVASSFSSTSSETKLSMPMKKKHSLYQSSQHRLQPPPRIGLYWFSFFLFLLSMILEVYFSDLVNKVLVF